MRPGRRVTIKEAVEHCQKVQEEAEEARRLERIREFKEFYNPDIAWETDDPPVSGEDILALYIEKCSFDKPGTGYLKAYVVRYDNSSSDWVTDDHARMGKPLYWILITYPERKGP